MFDPQTKLPWTVRWATTCLPNPTCCILASSSLRKMNTAGRGRHSITFSWASLASPASSRGSNPTSSWVCQNWRSASVSGNGRSTVTLKVGFSGKQRGSTRWSHTTWMPCCSGSSDARVSLRSGAPARRTS